jgi:hypothetical protein
MAREVGGGGVGGVAEVVTAVSVEALVGLVMSVLLYPYPPRCAPRRQMRSAQRAEVKNPLGKREKIFYFSFGRATAALRAGAAATPYPHL